MNFLSSCNMPPLLVYFRETIFYFQWILLPFLLPLYFPLTFKKFKFFLLASSCLNWNRKEEIEKKMLFIFHTRNNKELKFVFIFIHRNSFILNKMLKNIQQNFLSNLQFVVFPMTDNWRFLNANHRVLHCNCNAMFCLWRIIEFKFAVCLFVCLFLLR